MSQRSFDCKKTTDHDFIKPSTIRHMTKPLPNLSNFKRYPNFNPLKLKNKQGGPNLPINLDISNPLQLFNLFFPLCFIQYYIYYININTR
jgi:hypothetical protein